MILPAAVRRRTLSPNRPRGLLPAGCSGNTGILPYAILYSVRSRICMKYRCPTCGYIYDDEKQDVKFADLPDDWCCPVCGEPKSEFVPMDG